MPMMAPVEIPPPLFSVARSEVAAAFEADGAAVRTVVMYLTSPAGSVVTVTTLRVSEAVTIREDPHTSRYPQRS